MGGVAEEPLRFARPPVEGVEPERERGGVCTDIVSDWRDTSRMELMEEENPLLDIMQQL